MAVEPILLAQHESALGSFKVVCATLSPEQRGRGSPLSLTAERVAVSQLLKDHPYTLFVFSDSKEQHWHPVNARHDMETARRRGLRSIARTDGLPDFIVYRLYGLREEEVAVVEGTRP